MDTGLDLQATSEPFGFRFGPDVFGPEAEYRRLDAIRPSLMDPNCAGPDPVYAIVMDVGERKHQLELARRMLLVGVVAYAAGRLGREPVRSQGHVHRAAPHSGWQPPELFEIWQGRAVIYMQQFVEDDPGRCLAIEAYPGDRIVVPPAWAHAVISANPAQPLVFGAWCDRQYGFVYDGVRSHSGLAWFPQLSAEGSLFWTPNPHYRERSLETRRARTYPELGLMDSVPIYAHIETRPEAIQWVSDPALLRDIWPGFQP